MSSSARVLFLALVSFFLVGGGTALASYVVSTNSQIGPNTVSGHKPPAGKHSNLISGSVNATDLAPGAATLAKLAPNSVNGSKVANGSLTGFDLAAPVRLPSSCNPSQIARWTGSNWACANGSFWSMSGNSGTTSSDFLGTTDSQPLNVEVNSQRALRLEPTSSSPNLVGGFSGNIITAGAVGATIGGGGDASGNANTVTDDFGAVGGGRGNQAGDNAGTQSDQQFATVAGGHGNSATGQSGTVGGGGANTASGGVATVAGGFNNTASGNNAVVSGGASNVATTDRAVVSGGLSNVASGQDSVVAGGQVNSASVTLAAVGGGLNNTANGTSATVAGGGSNTASGFEGAVGGGGGNTASALDAVVPGGSFNTAGGTGSLAAGIHANATHNGSFVWGDDSTSSSTVDTGANSFVARASGGVTFYTAAGSTTATGATLPAGSGSWSSLSDRHTKDHISRVSSRSVLRKLRTLPIRTWSYKAQGGGVRHLGPMAQAFQRRFGLGESNRYIDDVDAQGVALAAIKGLAAHVQGQRARLRSQAARARSLRSRVRSQSQRVAALSRAVRRLERH